MSGFNCAVVDQSGDFFQAVKKDRFETLYALAKTYPNATRFIGLPIGLCEGLMEIAEVVALLGECLIKGVANIFGAPFCESCEFLRGCKQLFLELPYLLVFCAGFVPILILGQIVYYSIYTAIDPVAALAP